MQKEQTTLKQKKRIAIVLGAVVLCFCLLILRTAWLQLVDGEKLSSAAREQQTSDNMITPERGLIYDRDKHFPKECPREQKAEA